MTKLEKMIKTLPSIEYDWFAENEKAKYIQPKVEIYNYDGEDVIGLSTEQGNRDSFIYFDGMVVGIKEELQEWADKYNKYWECRYYGTYVLLDQ